MLTASAFSLLIAALCHPGFAQDKDWRLQDPVVITSEAPPESARLAFLWMAPVRICWAGDLAYLACLRGIKHSPVVDIWKENPDGTWSRTLSIEKANFPNVTAIGKNLGVISSFGENARSGYGNSIRFFLVADGKVKSSMDIATPDAASDRLTVSGVQVSGDRVSVFLLREKRGQAENTLIYVRSDDGGETWIEPREMGSTTMHEDSSRLGGYQWSSDHLGRFVSQRDGQLLFYRTEDGGDSWASEQIRLSDDLGDATRRVPLGSMTLDDHVGLVYLAVSPSDRAKGAYYFTSSDDEARTWKSGVAVTDFLKMDDPSLFINVAAAKDRIAVSYIETEGKWTKGEMKCRLAISEDRGKTWTHAPLESYYMGVAIFSTLAASPAKDRILFSTSICMDAQENKTNYVVVQEYSGRSLRPEKMTPDVKKELDALIARLSDDSFEVREAATQKIATYGRIAKDVLLDASKSTNDPEVRARIGSVLKSVFPECIRLDGKR